jgi:DNA-binding SARP family transcriptional activator
VYVRGLILLMAEAATVGDYEAALDAARAVLAVDPLRETVQRHTMRLLVLNGQRAEAIRQYNRCRALLSEECDVAPMPQTQAVYQSIVSGEIFNSLAVARSRVAAAPRPRDAAMPV